MELTDVPKWLGEVSERIDISEDQLVFEEYAPSWGSGGHVSALRIKHAHGGQDTFIYEAMEDESMMEISQGDMTVSISRECDIQDIGQQLMFSDGNTEIYVYHEY